MKKILILLFLPFLGISQQLTTQNILFDGNKLPQKFFGQNWQYQSIFFSLAFCHYALDQFLNIQLVHYCNILAYEIDND